jgi:hypothetical protein
MVAKRVHSYAYPQGGCGVMFSRFAARELYENFEDFFYYTTKIPNDDRCIGIWMLKHDITTWNGTSRWFVGHGFRGQTHFRHLPVGGPCPKKPKSVRGVRPFLHRLKDIGTWHVREDQREFMRTARAFVANLSENVFYMAGGDEHTLCFGNKKTVAGYYE